MFLIDSIAALNLAAIRETQNLTHGDRVRSQEDLASFLFDALFHHAFREPL